MSAKIAVIAGCIVIGSAIVGIATIRQRKAKRNLVNTIDALRSRVLIGENIRHYLVNMDDSQLKLILNHIGGKKSTMVAEIWICNDIEAELLRRI